MKYLFVVLFCMLLILECSAFINLIKKPNIYITRTDRVLDYTGKEMWVLEYTLNGQTQGTVFNGQDAMTQYVEYLHTIGNVYQNEQHDTEIAR